MKHLIIFISVILLKSCGSAQNVSDATNSNDMTTNKSLSGDYEIKVLGEDDLEIPLSISFNETKQSISGFSGCNRFFGSYKIKGNTISLSQIGMTKMMCKVSVNQIEQRFINALNSVNKFQITDTGLALHNDSEVLLNAILKKEKRTSSQEQIKMTYRASARGFFEMIWIYDKTFKYTNDRNLADTYKFQMSEKQYLEILSLYNNLDVESLPSLEPPSKTFQHDAAAFATLEITEGENTYKTKGFDHGKPPKPIALLVEKILSIKETMAKQ